MAAVTKLALTQTNTRLALENEALRKQVADLSLALDISNENIRDLRDVLMAQSPVQRAKRPLEPWQAARAEAMAAARAMAMRSGHAVKV